MAKVIPQAGRNERFMPRPNHRRVVPIILSLLALLVAGCAQSVSTQPLAPTATPYSTATTDPTNPTPTINPQTPLPTFSDWRAAYLGSDGRLHAVTLDGKSDLAGPVLPGVVTTGLQLASAGASPDGHLLAYVDSGPSDIGLTLFDVTAQGNADHEQRAGAIYTMYWSPDSARVALSDNEQNLWIARIAGGQPTMVPGTPFTHRVNLDGWIDATHLAIDDGPDRSSTTAALTCILHSLDITTGKLRTIATITTQASGSCAFVLSPDGTQALFDNLPFRDNPFKPVVERVNTTTGALTPLPNIARLTNASFTSLAWKPDTQTVAATSGYSDTRPWLLNLQTDSASRLIGIKNAIAVQQWSPDGRVLIVSTGYQLEIVQGPYIISAVTFASNGQPITTRLTQSAMSFPFIGFIRTR